MIITGGKFKGIKILTPDEKITRPTLSKTRESVFNMLKSMTEFEDKIFLDLFAGSGIVGLEAVSRGFNLAIFVENNKKTYQILSQNIKKFNLSANLQVKFSDSLKFLSKQTEQFDVIYIDPPYLSGIYENCLKSIAEKNLLKKTGIIILEHSENIDIKDFILFKQKKYGNTFISFLMH